MENIHTLISKWNKEADIKRDTEQNKLVEVLFGNFIFTEKPLEAIVINIEHREFCKVKDLDGFCEDNLDNYEGYLIPKQYKGKIKW